MGRHDDRPGHGVIAESKNDGKKAKWWWRGGKGINGVSGVERRRNAMAYLYVCFLREEKGQHGLLFILLSMPVACPSTGRRPIKKGRRREGGGKFSLALHPQNYIIPMACMLSLVVKEEMTFPNT